MGRGLALASGDLDGTCRGGRHIDGLGVGKARVFMRVKIPKISLQDNDPY